MDKLESQVMPVPPNLITALRAGFDAVANSIGIILIPIALDLLLWLGPHFQVKTILARYIDSVTSGTTSSLQSGDIVSTLTETLGSLASQFNLLSLLRTFPVGIPSLMVTKSPVMIPIGTPALVDITNPFIVIGMVIVILLLGLLIGSFYYSLVAQITLLGKIEFQKIIKSWLWAAVQVISLAFALVILFLVISIPSSCVITSIALFGLPLGQFAVFIYLGIILWLAFPLLFSAHGIFVNHNNALASVQRSMVTTRMTLPTTALFFLCIFTISEGLDILWRIPQENSWLVLIGVGGHAFVTSALLAASFIYYRDADLWTQGTIKLMKSNRVTQVKGG